MIQFQEVGKEFANRILFSDVTFSVNRGERVGLVGRNGHGKSTLLKMITKDISYDYGQIIIPKGYRIGILTQHLQFSEKTVLAECKKVLSAEEKFDMYKVEAMLMGVGLEEKFWRRDPNSLSGGQQIRINLTKLLLGNFDMLLLDEPTNYLDILSMRWLAKFLKRFAGEVILITHDRDFMANVVTHTMGIHRNRLLKVEGGPSQYLATIAEQERIYESTRVNQERKRKDIEEFVTKFRAKARQASLAQSRQKMLEKMDDVAKLDHVQTLNFRFNYADFQAKTLMSVKDLSFGYEKGHPLFHQLSFHVNKKDRIAVIGGNGKGKSTLLNVLTKSLIPWTGDINTHHNTQIGHFGQTNIDRLSSGMTIAQEIQAENDKLTFTQVRDICGTMMFSGNDADKKIEHLSGGEKSRVLLGKILAKKTNLLILDEPTNHLDQESIEVLVEELKNFEGALIIVTHSEHILRELATKLVIFRKSGAEEFIGGYDDFLNRIGWEEEGGEEQEQGPSSADGPSLSWKEQKQRRSELIKERSKLLKPINRRIEEIEGEIEAWEAMEEKANQDLITASNEQNSAKIQESSKLLSQAKDSIENLFAELETKSMQRDELAEEYEKLLSDL